MDEFDRAWREFRARQRLECGGHTKFARREAHEVSASFILAVDTGQFAERLKPLRDALRPFPFVSLHPDHFMHISLVFVGLLSKMPRSGLEEIEARARESLAGFGAFPVRLANLGVFPKAAFVEAHSGGKLEELRDTLRLGCGIKTTVIPPHLTLAYFQAPDGTEAPEALISAIDRYRSWPVGEVLIEEAELSLLKLEEEYPHFKTAAKIPL